MFLNATQISLYLEYCLYVCIFGLCFNKGSVKGEKIWIFFIQYSYVYQTVRKVIEISYQVFKVRTTFDYSPCPGLRFRIQFFFLPFIVGNRFASF